MLRIIFNKLIEYMIKYNNTYIERSERILVQFLTMPHVTAKNGRGMFLEFVINVLAIVHLMDCWPLDLFLISQPQYWGIVIDCNKI